MTIQLPQKTPKQSKSGVWRFFRNNLFTKVFLILLCCFSTKLFFSCVDSIYFDMAYNKMDLKMIDHRGEAFSPHYSDTVYSDAVCIEFTLSDSSMYYASNTFNVSGLFSFETVNATSPQEYFQAVHSVQDIRVSTIYDIDDTFLAGDEISDSILYSFDFHRSGLYRNKASAIEYANGLRGYPECPIRLFLKSSVKNTIAQFKVEVSLDDGSKLIGTTNLCSIKPSNL